MVCIDYRYRCIEHLHRWRRSSVRKIRRHIIRHHVLATNCEGLSVHPVAMLSIDMAMVFKQATCAIGTPKPHSRAAAIRFTGWGRPVP
jgi:hypothetical protein